MSEGWIKLHRKVLDNALMSDPDYFALWVRLLLMANHEEKHVIYNNRKMPVKSGSFITSRLKLSQQSGIHRSKIDRILNYLKIEQQIEQVNLGTGRLISITNWEKYQARGQVSEQPVSSQWAASEQPVSTNKNDKNERMKEKAISPPSASSDFEVFWEIYPKKVGKQDARTAWHKHCSNGELAKIQSALSWQSESNQWKEEDGRFIPNPATYIRQHRWEDQPPVRETTMSTDDIRKLIKEQHERYRPN